jgi:NAD(P)H-quinone oxidoreductase subunit 5
MTAPGLHTQDVLVLVALGAPASLLALLGGATLFDRPFGERTEGLLARWTMTISFASCAVALAAHVATGTPARVVSCGSWLAAGRGPAVDLLVDGMSLGFALLTTAVAGVVAAFSNRYLHREPGYNRYFVLFAAFVTGMLLVVLAGSVEVLFAGWEILGLSSALLVAFFHERPAPVRNALRVFAVYRVSDAAMLAAAVLAHHFSGSGSLLVLFGPSGDAGGGGLSPEQAWIIGLLLVIAVTAKCALLPFSGWLPRAMEGPTPSSAVYYGALSIHAGCFLLLRAAPLLERSVSLSVLVGAAGVATALYATLAARVQADVKTALALASLTQVGIIVVEIALGLRLLAMLHLVGHVCFRLLQFLSAPNLLHDFHELQNAVGAHFRPTGGHLERLLPERTRLWLYRFALERGYLDAILDRAVTAPFLRITRAADRLDRRISGVASRLGPTTRGDRSRRDTSRG